MSWETVRFGDLYAVESRNGLTNTNVFLKRLIIYHC